jgi:hypothetical protein
MSGPVLASLTIVIPSIELTRVDAFMRELDAASIPYEAKMDSHPSAEQLAALPPRLRLLLGAVSQ